MVSLSASAVSVVRHNEYDKMIHHLLSRPIRLLALLVFLPCTVSPFLIQRSNIISHPSHHRITHRKEALSVPNNEIVMIDSGSRQQVQKLLNDTVVLPPNAAFPDTVVGEQVSVLSFNCLAPYYHYLGHPDRSTMMDQDYRIRVPASIRLAKQSNADILLLQEVEEECPGDDKDGTTKHLRNLLQESETFSSPHEPQHRINGYDGYMWSSLHPNRRPRVVNGTEVLDPVGLAVAWRKERHELISSQSFRRGILVQLRERATGATMVLANLHLPAKPSAIGGRLKTVSVAIRKILEVELEISGKPGVSSPVHGMILIAGDLNCEDPSVTTRLLTRGTVPYGKVKDRNYQIKLSKSEAAAMKQPLAFRPVYDLNLRRSIAAVTVSLQGRGPGAMDHMFYMDRLDVQAALKHGGLKQSSIQGSLRAGDGKRKKAYGSKRTTRRQRAELRSQMDPLRSFTSTADQEDLPLGIRSVLATVDAYNETRTEIIQQGLPNLEEGFPSDHLPIGALFGAPSAGKALVRREASMDDVESPPHHNPATTTRQNTSNLTWNARRRRRLDYSLSLLQRRRHNTILRILADWLQSSGQIAEMVRDRPLYKWMWAKDIVGLGRKMRAPDICCLVQNQTLIIIEIAVTGRPDEVIQTKTKKYEDLVLHLRQSLIEKKDMNMEVWDVMPLVFDKEGAIPDTTLQNLERLHDRVARDDASNNSMKFNTLLSALQESLRETRV